MSMLATETVLVDHPAIKVTEIVYEPETLEGVPFECVSIQWTISTGRYATVKQPIKQADISHTFKVELADPAFKALRLALDKDKDCTSITLGHAEFVPKSSYVHPDDLAYAYILPSIGE